MEQSVSEDSEKGLGEIDPPDVANIDGKDGKQAPIKPARGSLAQKEREPKPILRHNISNGETGNEADVSSMSSQEEPEDVVISDPIAMQRTGYTRLPSMSSLGGGDTSGSEECDVSPRLRRESLKFESKLNDVIEVSSESSPTANGILSNHNENKDNNVGSSSTLCQAMSPDSKSDSNGVGAVLDLTDPNDLKKKRENRYLDGMQMHEFHSTGAASVSCELTLDTFTGRERGRSVAEVKELAFARLQEELNKAQEEMKLKDEEVGRLLRVREEVESELEELTACLFQEAHAMVRTANIKQAAAEKSLNEANMKIDVLQAELKALKALVITSTPSMPNKHLHPHLDPKKDSLSSNGNSGMNFLRGHKRSPSHNNLKYGRDCTPPGSPEKEPPPIPFCPENYEIDPIYHKEFVSWREKPEFDKTHPFLERIYNEDIEPCLNFTNKELAVKVQQCVEGNSISIEAVTGKSSFPKLCALSEAPRLCKYRMKLGEDGQWFYISQLCRNRIASVCDFLSYLRYIHQGLVRSGVHDVYWEIIRLRKMMALSRLGISS